MEINGSKIFADLGSMFMSSITSKLRELKSMFARFGANAEGYVVTEGSDQSNPLNSALSGFSDLIDNLLKTIGGAVNPTVATAAEAIETNFNASSAIFTEVDTALGLSNSTEIKNLFKTFVDDYLKEGIPALEANNGQRGTKTALAGLLNNVTAAYTIALAEKYPNASEANIEKAARQLAGSQIGYDTLPDTHNTEILVSRLPEPRAGSLAALVMNGQINAHGNGSFTLSRITNNAAALASVKALVSAPIEPDSTLIEQVGVWVAANNAKAANMLRFEPTKVVDADNSGGFSPTEIATALVNSGVDLTDLNAAITQLTRAPGAAPTRQPS